MRLKHKEGGRASSENGKNYGHLVLHADPRIHQLTYLRNRGELAEGWYDPETLQKATQNTQAAEVADDNYRPESRTTARREVGGKHKEASPRYDRNTKQHDSDSDDSIGPSLPGQEGRSKGRMGPSIPNMQDLELKRGIPISYFSWLS